MISTLGENVGQVTVGSNPPGFEIDTNTCAPNKTILLEDIRSIFVRFKPGIPGEKEALIGITADTATAE
ncbi:MAG TPA: hypothetical protein VIL85_28695 [Thermomicrobiales bacterium]|jgi:hypothetical protein